MSRFGDGRFWAALGATIVLVLGLHAAAAAADPPDYSSPGEAFNILPPGQAGTFPATVNSRDQLFLYDALTPLKANVTDATLTSTFKKNVFGLGGLSVKRVETFPGRPDLTVTRDSFDVPHIEATTRDDVMYGVGFVTAEDRGLLMDTFRGPGRVAALDIPGVNPFQLATSFKVFTTSQDTEDFLASQVSLIEADPRGQRIIDDIDNYLQGINDFRTLSGNTGRPWNRNDVVATAALIAAVFGKGGGDEARRAQLLSALKDRLGADEGEQVWNDLRELKDPETSVSIDGRFNGQAHKAKQRQGNAIIDAGSLDTAGATNSATAQASRQSASNAVLVGAQRSATGHPFFVAGPQVGYFYPQVLMEIDVHGGGIDARGATFPGAGPYVELGRGKDFSWSATSAGNDNIDIFAEELCGDDTHYVFDGECREMTSFHAGQIGTDPPIVFKETVHGPVIGYATVDGERVALSSARTTRGREVLAAFPFADLNANVPTDAQSFFDVASQIEFTFNWFYADQNEIGMYSSGRLPVRHPHVDIGLPTWGTGRYEWRGFLPADKHPHGTTPADGTIVNWNNKPAAGWEAADDQWGYGATVRNNLLERTISEQQTHTLASTVGAMNKAATQDLRAVKAIRGLIWVLATGPAPNPRVARMVELLQDWRAQGSHRLDLNNDGVYDHAGTAILDTAWPKIADAVMSPVLGPQLGDLAAIMTRDNKANSQGSSYNSGWYGYVDKDLRTIAGRNVAGRFKTRFCGNGDLATCRDSLYAALDAAGQELEAVFENPNPDDWRSDASAERIFFAPGILGTTMRWTNRPTFQQAISYSSHR
jgi:acyl-homoserine lactone acylase PvdQ